jgi:hypothetical protein
MCRSRYDFFADSPASADEWRTIVWYMEQKIKKGQQPDKEFSSKFGPVRGVRDFETERSRYCKIMEELKQLYTAFTRARVSLFMFDSSESKRQPMYHALVSMGLAKLLDMHDVNEQLKGDNLDLDKGERAQVARIRAKSSTPEEYRKAGKQLYDMGLFDAAIHPFTQSGDTGLMHAAKGRAMLVEWQRNRDKGATVDSLVRLVEDAGYELLQSQLPECMEQAMICFYQLPRTVEYAVGIAAKLGGRHLLAAAKRMHDTRNFVRAAELYSAVPDHLQAAECWQKASQTCDRAAVNATSSVAPEEWSHASKQSEQSSIAMSHLARALGALDSIDLAAMPDRAQATQIEKKIQSFAKRVADDYRQEERYDEMFVALQKFATLDAQLAYLKKNKLGKQYVELAIKTGKYELAVREQLSRPLKDKAESFRRAADMMKQSLKPEGKQFRARLLLKQYAVASANATLTSRKHASRDFNRLRAAKKALEECHEILNAATDSGSSVNLATAKLLLGTSSGGDSTLLSKAYTMFSDIDSRCGQLAVVVAVLHHNLEVQFSSCLLACEGPKFVDDVDRCHYVLCLSVELACNIIQDDANILLDPFFQLEKSSNDMISVEALNVNFMAVLDRSHEMVKLRNDSLAESGNSMANPHQCCAAVKSWASVMSLDKAMQAAQKGSHKLGHSSDILDQVRAMRCCPPQHEHSQKCQLKVQAPRRPNGRWKLKLHLVDPTLQPTDDGLSCQGIRYLQDTVSRLRAHVVLCEQTAQICETHPDKKKQLREVKKLCETSCDKLCELILGAGCQMIDPYVHHAVQSSLRNDDKDSARSSFQEEKWDELGQPKLLARIEFRSKRHTDETSVRKLFLLWDALAQDGPFEHSYFGKFVIKYGRRPSCLTYLRAFGDQKTAQKFLTPTVQLLYEPGPQATFHFLMYLQAAKRPLDAEQAIGMLECAVCTWLWKVTPQRSRQWLSLPQRWVQKLQSDEVQSDVDTLRTFADQCCYVCCSDWMAAPPVQGHPQRALALILLLLIAHHSHKVKRSDPLFKPACYSKLLQKALTLAEGCHEQGTQNICSTCQRIREGDATVAKVDNAAPIHPRIIEADGSFSIRGSILACNKLLLSVSGDHLRPNPQSKKQSRSIDPVKQINRDGQLLMRWEPTTDEKAWEKKILSEYTEKLVLVKDVEKEDDGGLEKFLAKVGKRLSAQDRHRLISVTKKVANLTSLLSKSNRDIKSLSLSKNAQKALNTAIHDHGRVPVKHVMEAAQRLFKLHPTISENMMLHALPLDFPELSSTQITEARIKNAYKQLKEDLEVSLLSCDDKATTVSASQYADDDPEPLQSVRSWLDEIECRGAWGDAMATHYGDAFEQFVHSTEQLEQLDVATVESMVKSIVFSDTTAAQIRKGGKAWGVEVEQKNHYGQLMAHFDRFAQSRTDSAAAEAAAGDDDEEIEAEAVETKSDVSGELDIDAKMRASLANRGKLHTQFSLQMSNDDMKQWLQSLEMSPSALEIVVGAWPSPHQLEDVTKAAMLERGLDPPTAERLQQALSGDDGFASEPLFWSTGQSDDWPLDLEHEYLAHFGDTDRFRFNAGALIGVVDLEGLVQRVVEKWDTNAMGVAEQDLEAFSMFEARASVALNQSQFCACCGAHVDIGDPHSHFSGGHFERHQAFRFLKHIAAKCLAPLVAVARMIVRYQSLFSRGDVTQMEDLKQDITDENSAAVKWYSPTGEGWIRHNALVKRFASTLPNIYNFNNLLDFHNGPLRARQFLLSSGTDISADTLATFGRHFAYPWITLQVHYTYSARMLVQYLQQANDIRSECLQDLQAAILQIHTIPMTSLAQQRDDELEYSMDKLGREAMASRKKGTRKKQW